MPVPHRLFLAACATLSFAGAARAQTDLFAPARQAAANQLGVMEFCQAQGHADAPAVTAQRDAIGRLPPAPPGAPPTDAAEALGREGTLSANGAQTTLASLASSHNTTVAALCEQMAASAKQMGAATSSATGMPSLQGLTPMPGLTGVPGMPGGVPNPAGAPRLPPLPPAAPR